MPLMTGCNHQIPTVEGNSEASLLKEPPFSEDVTLDEKGSANMSWHCAGVRMSTLV